MASNRGPYQLKQRAERRDQTRLRLVEAAADLHGEVGPAFTTMADVAERAGVSKMTAYRHFPTEKDLFGACSRHFIDAHPLPDPQPWHVIGDPNVRMRQALGEIYAYYDRHQERIANVLRDSLTMPVGGVFRDAERAWADALLGAWPARTRRRPSLKAGVAIAVHFETWHHLISRQGLTSRQVIDYTVPAIGGAANVH